jgi:hypothetical protein
MEVTAPVRGSVATWPPLTYRVAEDVVASRRIVLQPEPIVPAGASVTHF